MRKNAGLWHEYYDEHARTAYYYNTDTGESQFQPPPDFLLDWIEVKEQDGVLDAESIPARSGGPWEEFTLLRPNIFTDNVKKEREEAREKFYSENGDGEGESGELFSQREPPVEGSTGATDVTKEKEEDPVLYYRHFQNQELRVVPPNDFKEQNRMGTLRASGRVLPRRQVNGRIELMDSRTGNVFYFDRQDRMYSWDKPVGFDDVWLDAAFEQDQGKSLVARSKRKKDIGLQREDNDESGGGGGGGWGMYVDPDTETTFYYHTGMKALQASLPPSDAHGMELPPSAVGSQGNALARGKMKHEIEIVGPPRELEAIIATVDVPQSLMSKLARVQRERVPYEERRTHLRWIEEFIESEEFITADSVADQILQMQNETRGFTHGADEVEEEEKKEE